VAVDQGEPVGRLGESGSPLAHGPWGDIHGGSPVEGALGILGGTFDPIHHAHLAIAEQAREELGLRGVLFVPAGVPPHKPGRPISAAADRLAMVELGIAGNPAFRVSRIELDRPGPSYTLDTLRQLRVSEAGTLGREPVLIMSVEAVALLPEWHEPAEILRIARIAIAPRRGHDALPPWFFERHFAGLCDRFLFLRGPDLGHSASDIRARAAFGHSIRYLVPDAVERYVRAHGLYDSDEWREAFAAHHAGSGPASGTAQ
jgi:nicotinate-nucleotide adenylyltransferase